MVLNNIYVCIYIVDLKTVKTGFYVLILMLRTYVHRGALKCPCRI